MVDWLRRSITFLTLRSMESVCFFSSSTFLMCFSGACCSNTPTHGVWSQLLLSVWNICNPFCGSMMLLWNWKWESLSLSSLSNLVRLESLSYNSSILSLEVLKEFSVALLILFISGLLDFLDLMVIEFPSLWFLSGVFLDFFRKWDSGCPVLP